MATLWDLQDFVADQLEVESFDVLLVRWEGGGRGERGKGRGEWGGEGKGQGLAAGKWHVCLREVQV